MPSSRDSISGWLDVLTSMLALPESQRLQVRDELEDHLRSRVDDLLITGTPEPEAIRIAVAELGETAELAKLISHAHTRINPRRRIMNIALITAAVAGLSIGGYSLNSAPSAGELDPSMQVVTAAIDSNEPADETRMLDIVNMPMLMAFDAIADMWGFAIDVHSLDPHIVGDLQHRNVTVAGEMTLARAIQTLKIQSLQHASVLTTEINGGVIELLTRDELIRRTVITRVSLLPSWITTEQREGYAESIGRIVEVKYDLDYTSIEVVNGAVIVAAPPNIQDEVTRLMMELEAVAETQQEQAIKAQEIAKREKDLLRSKAVQNLMVEHERIDSEVRKVTEVLEETLVGIQSLINQIEQEVKAPHPNSPGLEVLEGFLEARRGQVARYRIQITKNEARRDFLQKKIFESEYAHLFEGLE